MPNDGVPFQLKVTLARLSLLLFLSGSAGLIYEVVWTCLFTDITGSTVLSMTAVLSVFLLCLAGGAYCFGRVDVGGKDALILCGRLEIGIALSALPVGWILIVQRSWIGARLPDSDHFVISLLLQLLGALLFLGIPTVLMGGDPAGDVK